ncbi:C-C motif chemokine 20a.3 isoform X1 [Etheostoma spectabile]|uniref:C-C motif chemokine 20a.3 isoform X1 n=1 Tax=Etheostoma spectabile TaxID=54343 RepID=UPI0013AF55CB|nr:C-C motif chemokine 20-like isoform X1 [Etheostoma spectabile]
MVSIKAAVVGITLLTVCLLATNASPAVRYGCCRNYMATKIPFSKIKGYSVQTVNEMCPINAIIFHTKKGQACTNPALHWVMDYVNRLRSKAQMVHIKTSQALE